MVCITKFEIHILIYVIILNYTVGTDVITEVKVIAAAAQLLYYEDLNEELIRSLAANLVKVIQTSLQPVEPVMTRSMGEEGQFGMEG